MRAQRRFAKRFEIEAEINKCKRKAKAKNDEAAKFNGLADDLIKKSNVPGTTAGARNHLAEMADEQRKKATRSLRSAERIIDVRIPALGRTLAAFQTNTLFPGDDQAVVLQK